MINWAHYLAMFLLPALLLSCGDNNADSHAAAAPSVVTLVVTPSLGQFAQGATVRVKDRNGKIVGSGTVESSGSATINFIANSVSTPLIIEAGLNGEYYFDEKALGYLPISDVPPSGAAIRAVLPDLIRQNIGVTAITEIAAGLLLTSAGTLPSTADAASVVTANLVVGRQFAVADPLSPPTAVSEARALNSSNIADEYALRLAALAYMTELGDNALQVTRTLRDDMADGAFDGRVQSASVPQEAIKAITPATAANAPATEMEQSLQNARTMASAVFSAESSLDAPLGAPVVYVRDVIAGATPLIRATMYRLTGSSPAVLQAATRLSLDVAVAATSKFLPSSGMLSDSTLSSVVSAFVADVATNAQSTVRFFASQDVGLHTTTIADFDNDGSVEPFGFSNDGSGQLKAWPEGSVTYRPGGETDGVGGGAGAADFNNDGVMDLMDDAYYGYLSTLLTGTFNNGRLALSEDPAFLSLGIQGNCETMIVADFNNDGFTDAFIPCYADEQTRLANPDIHSYLLINDGAGHFAERAIAAGVAMVSELRPEGAQAVDINGDGWIDIYCAGNLFLNSGDLTFSLANEAWQLPAIFDEGVQFLDFDNDGNIDLALWTPGNGIGLRLFKNIGSRFVEQTDLLPKLETRAYTWGLTALDANADGWMDLVVPGDTVLPNELLINDHGKFVSLGAAGTVGAKLARGAGGSVGDFNGDGMPDLYTRGGEILINVSVPVSQCGFRIRLTSHDGRLNEHGRVVRISSNEDAGETLTRIVSGGSGQAAQDQYDIDVATPTCGVYTIETLFGPGLPAHAEVDSTSRPLVVLRSPRRPPASSSVGL
jgi:hypothetical protein